MDEGARGPLGRTQTPDDANLEPTLRPRRLEQYFGQDAVKESLRIAITAAQARQELYDLAPDIIRHVLASCLRLRTSVGRR